MTDKYRKITIKISNEELDRMEDFLILELSEEKEEKYRKKCLEIWARLVREWDKKENS